jgi:hypothetical protein
VCFGVGEKERRAICCGMSLESAGFGASLDSYLHNSGEIKGVAAKHM